MIKSKLILCRAPIGPQFYHQSVKNRQIAVVPYDETFCRKFKCAYAKVQNYINSRLRPNISAREIDATRWHNFKRKLCALRERSSSHAGKRSREHVRVTNGRYVVALIDGKFSVPDQLLSRKEIDERRSQERSAHRASSDPRIEV